MSVAVVSWNCSRILLVLGVVADWFFFVTMSASIFVGFVKERRVVGWVQNWSIRIVDEVVGGLDVFTTFMSCEICIDEVLFSLD